MRTLISVFLLVLNTLHAQVPSFTPHELATDLAGGYQVVIADVNGDGKPDIIALASGMPDLLWFENPSWKRHVLASGLNRMINCAFEVVDGAPVVVVAHEFNNEAEKSLGIVSVLTPGNDRLLPWKAREIDRIPTSHRIRPFKLNGETVFLNLPLTSSEASPPDFHGHVPIVYYRPGVWKRETISTEEQGVLHGVWIERENSFLTASFLGTSRHSFDGKWNRTLLNPGDRSPWPKSGASDVTVAGRFIAAIEPWHGNQVVVYGSAANSRRIIDATLIDGHTIISAQLTPGKEPQIIAGYRGKGTSVYIYNLLGDEWQRVLLDDKMAAASCAAADLNNDGRIDLICIGTSTKNLKWYENMGR